ncbi:hypothetical protein C8N46_104278 [Kordia periserrulae]|uniref:Uncharacterized protein n=1 Tax=Kordia periserrulae TaxID=701523 RepID=A0A2T6BZZ5_9FLAO|nr:hypothetical protein [Kordia periserrulae]PTX61635.1 hypothetical protein C8N46_104278 [Kordia periserrulae]
MNEEEKQALQTEILDTLVAIEKLQLKRKSLLKEASLLGIIALGIMGIGAYGSVQEWTEFPIFQGAIAAGGILLAIAFRPLQQCKQQIDLYEKKLSELETWLKKNNLEYKADVRVSRNQKGDYVVQKSIKLATIK